MRIEQQLKRETHREYYKHLKDYRWFEFSAKIIEKHGEFCSACDCDSDANFQVHHLGYKTGHLPWEYEYDEVQVLCDACHRDIHVFADEIWNEILKCSNKWILYEAIKAVRDVIGCHVIPEQIIANLNQPKK